MELTTAKLLNIFGLLFDIAGGVLIFKFGVASTALTFGRESSHDRYSKLGLGFFILGFVLQLISNLVSGK